MSKQDNNSVAPDDIINVAVDDGHAGIKLVILEDGRVAKSLRIHSRARAGIHGATMIDHPGAGAEEGFVVPGYATGGENYTIGNFADAENARFDDYPFSGLNRVLVAHALRLAGLGGKKIRLATGLPLSRFFKGEKINEDVINQKLDSFDVPVVPADNSAVAEIVEHRVFPEGLSAWIDYAILPDGTMREEVSQETIAVIDVGGRTTDTAVILPDRRIDHARSGSADIGVLNVIEAVGVALHKELGAEVPAHSIEQALTTKTIRAWGKSVDISAHVEAAADDVLSRVMREVNRRLGTGVDLDKIILVGGGAHVFKTALNRYPNIEVADEPEFANARGFAKYLGI